MAFSEAAHWRDSSRTARFFVIDAAAAFPLVLFLLHMRVWSFVVAVLTMSFFTLLRHYGFSVPVFLRWLRCFIAGPRKYSVAWWRE